MSDGADSYETQRSEWERLEAQRREAEAEAIDGELAWVCGTLNMASARQVELIRQALDNGSYALSGVRSAEQWVAWKCGVSPRHARALVAAARRLPELPETAAAFAAGELSEDQVGVICRHAPDRNDAEVATPGPLGHGVAAAPGAVALRLRPAPQARARARTRARGRS